MVARPSSPYRSANAGEFSADVKGRIDIKQYYSASLAMKNIEPVPQSGFRQMGGTRKVGTFRREIVGLAITSPTLIPGPHSGANVVVWTGTVSTLQLAAVSVEGFSITAGTATFVVERFLGSWQAVGAPFAVTAGVPVTRLAAEAPSAANKGATAIRIRATFSVAATVGITAVRAFVEDGQFQDPRYCELNTDDGARIMAAISPKIVDFWTAAGFQGAALVETITAGLLPDLEFYAEANTIGIFHGQLETVRLFLAGALNDWRADLWPYAPVPEADLGGIYVMTTDKWDFFVRWSANIEIYITVTINGETTPSIALGGGTPVLVAAATPTDWTNLANDIEAAINALPNISSGVVVTEASGGAGAWRFTVEFAGDTSGEEYEFTAIVPNTASASALAYHIQIGKTEQEAVFSATRGWPGGVDLAQDRQVLYRIPALSGTLAISRAGEYFDFDAAGRTDDAARLDRLRSLTSEIILAVKESKYLLVFTDRAVYFATSRIIDRNTPLNFVIASEIGIQPNCRPFDLEGVVYYVAMNPNGIDDYVEGGNQLLSAVYDDVSTTYNADPKSLLASHLVSGVIRTARQKPASDQDAGKGWMMRRDGRLVAAQIIKNQDITGFCEWRAAKQGAVKEIRVDGANRLWLAVSRDDSRSHEIYDADIFLQDAVIATADLSGVVAGLGVYPNGTELWAVPTGFDYALGPYQVTAGQIAMEDYFPGDILIGRWQAPYFESMPEVLVTGNDDVVIRPGRIHSVDLNIIDTASIAVGANGTAAADIPLIDMNDQADQAIPAKTRKLQVTGLKGMVEYPTLTVTQTFPGKLRVRDYATTAKL